MDDAPKEKDAEYFDLDDEERYGELTKYLDDVGETYVVNPVTGDRVYLQEL